MTREYDEGDEPGGTEPPTANLQGSYQLPVGVGPETYDKIHAVGDCTIYPITSKAQLQAIIDGSVDTPTFADILLGTYLVPGPDQQEFTAGMFVSVTFDIESKDAT